jgi:dihydrofolate reductase
VRIVGVSVARQALKEELVDELQLQLVPVLLGDGLRLFDGLDARNQELERLRVVASPEVTHLWFRVLREP